MSRLNTPCTSVVLTQRGEDERGRGGGRGRGEHGVLHNNTTPHCHETYNNNSFKTPSLSPSLPLSLPPSLSLSSLAAAVKYLYRSQRLKAINSYQH